MIAGIDAIGSDALEALCSDETREIGEAAQRVRRARDLVAALPLLEARLVDLVTARSSAPAVGGSK